MATETLGLGALSDMLPDSLKEAIRDKYVLVGKNVEELHAVLRQLRAEYNVPPWNVLTLYFKRYAQYYRTGRTLSSSNRWPVIGDEAAYLTKYANLSNHWVTLEISVKREGVATGTPVSVAVHPKGKLIWSYVSEAPLRSGVVGIPMPTGSYLNINSKWVLENARNYVRAGYTDGRVVKVDYNIDMKLSRKRRERQAAAYEKHMDELATQLNPTEDHKQVEPTEAPKALPSPHQVLSEQTILSESECLILRGILGVATAPLQQANASSFLEAAEKIINRLTGIKEVPNEV